MRLKVFVTSDGFTDYVVAASSRAKALAAWGAHQDLFATGGARETNDPELIEAASASPGTVLRRPSAVVPMPTRARAKVATNPAAPASRRLLSKPRGPSPAQLHKIADLEAQIAAAADEHEAELAQIAAERQALETRREASDAAFLARRNELREALRKARLALR